MRIVLHTKVKKRYKKLNVSQQRHFRERRDMFLENPFHPLLNNHALHDIWKGYRSINITGDLRVVYEEIGPDVAHFIDLGTHSELYE